MKMKNIFITSALAAAVLASGSAYGASAKFAATYTTVPALHSVADLSDYQNIDRVATDSKTGYTIATIKVPQDKELLVGVSAEIGIVTNTSVKGKNGGSAKAIAGGEAYVTVWAVPVSGGVSQIAEPGEIILSKRVQELDATLGGVIQSCTDGDLDGTIDIATDCEVTDEEIGLFQDTTAAHHFNFVLPNMDQGDYDIKAVFTTGSRAKVVICDGDELVGCDLYDADGTVEGAAYASAIINKTMVTVQQVRAEKGGIIDATITE